MDSTAAAATRPTGEPVRVTRGWGRGSGDFTPPFQAIGYRWILGQGQVTVYLLLSPPASSEQSQSHGDTEYPWLNSGYKIKQR